MTLLIILTMGLILIKAVWIWTELHFSKERFNFQMFKTNGVEAIIVILQILAAIFTPLPKTQFNGILVIAGVLMYIVGFVLAFLSRSVMNKSWGVPGVHNKTKQSKLVTTGPFSFSRNPIYVAFTLLYFGYAAAIQSWLIILRIPLAVYFYKSAVREEINLEKIFGKEYISYKKRVPRFF
ncbi:MAG: methyltransferase family protein [Candidatus Levyibacteriota bacterium]